MSLRRNKYVKANCKKASALVRRPRPGVPSSIRINNLKEVPGMGDQALKIKYKVPIQDLLKIKIFQNKMAEL